MLIAPPVIILCGLSLIASAVFGWRQHRRFRTAQATLAKERREARYHRISSENAEAGLLVQTMDGITLWANDAYYNITKRTEDEVIGRNPLSFVMPPDRTPSAAEIKAFRHNPDDLTAESVTLRENIRGDGKLIWVEVSTSYHEEGAGEKRAILVCRDVTDSIEKERQLQETSEKLAHTAAHDTLTGVANRAEFVRFVDLELAKTHQDSRLGILHIDLDSFKQINDTHGHAAGDAILVTIAARINDCLRETDLVARIGGDEFIAVCTGLRTLDQLEQIGETLIDAVKRPIIWDKCALHCGISIGAAISSDRIKTADELLLRSDFALYDVKQRGRGRVAAYNRRLYARQVRETQIAADLHRAVQSRSLHFLYQPTVSMISGEIRSFETLVRLEHPQNGLINPVEFLPVAQSIGIMADIDFLAMQAAMDLKARLNAMSFQTVNISFNVSPAAMAHPDFMANLDHGLSERGLQPQEITVELLEAVVLGAQRRETPAGPMTTALEAAGVVTFLDDFGGGNAGLRHLGKLAINGIKLDRALTDDILDNHTNKTILSGLCTMCRELDFAVVAKGVESAEHAAMIARLGGDVVQGYWVARPMPEAEVITWLVANTDCPRGIPSLSKVQLIA